MTIVTGIVLIITLLLGGGPLALPLLLLFVIGARASTSGT
jgi:hypothetical protein